MKRYLCVGMLLLFSGAISYAQASKDKWWEVLHNWDGVTPWQNYMQLSAKYMGPNGMPVPEINNGKIAAYSSFEIGGAIHNGIGDHTENGFFNVFLRAGERAAFNVYLVPYEEYDMDTFTSRHTRNTRDFDGSGTSVGDVYLTAFFQIFKEKQVRPDLLLTFGIKTASGSNLEAARFTDAPGYYFSLSTGKTIKFKSVFFKSVRPYLLGGAYMWQTYRSDYKQDDAPWYGYGLTANFKNFSIDDNVSGYSGYLKNGDKPMVNKLSATSTFDAFINVRVLYQYGMRDYDYKSFMLSALLNLNKIKESIVKGRSTQ